MTTPYPDTFYVAHRLLTGSAFPKPTWGDVLDGPEADFAHVVTLVVDAFDCVPTVHDLRVWCYEPGKELQNVTASVIEAYNDRVEAFYD